VDTSRGELTVSSSRSRSILLPAWVDLEKDTEVAGVSHDEVEAAVVSLLVDTVTATASATGVGVTRTAVEVALVANTANTGAGGVGATVAVGGRRTAERAITADASIVSSIDHLLGLLPTWRSVWLVVVTVAFETCLFVFRVAPSSLADVWRRSVCARAFVLLFLSRLIGVLVGLTVD